MKARIGELESRARVLDQTENELRTSQQRYAALIETLPHGIQECTVEGLITLSNNAHHRICGYPDGELIGKHIWDHVADEDEKKAFPNLLEHLAAEQPAPQPYITKKMTKDGHRHRPGDHRTHLRPIFHHQKPGEGTGMGLAVVHGIVRECGGSIHVQSVKDQGMTFEDWLPIIEAEDDIPLSDETPRPVGNERLLYVDDEPDVVDVGLQMLELLGYRVTGINASHEVLDLFRRSPGEFDLVITDMTMPGMTGDLLSQLMLTIRPDIPINICTGYSEKINEGSIQSMGLAGIAHKPLIIADLADLVRLTLDRSKSGSPFSPAV